MFNDPQLEELTRQATPLGLRAEEVDGEYMLYRGDEHIASLWYLSEFDAWTDIEPGSEPLDHIMAAFAPPKKRVVREEVFIVRYQFGRRRAPKKLPAGAADEVLAAAVSLAGEVAPGAVKVEVSSRAGRMSRPLVPPRPPAVIEPDERVVRLVNRVVRHAARVRRKT